MNGHKSPPSNSLPAYRSHPWIPVKQFIWEWHFPATFIGWTWDWGTVKIVKNNTDKVKWAWASHSISPRTGPAGQEIRQLGFSVRCGSVEGLEVCIVPWLGPKSTHRNRTSNMRQAPLGLSFSAPTLGFLSLKFLDSPTETSGCSHHPLIPKFASPLLTSDL